MEFIDEHGITVKLDLNQNTPKHDHVLMLTKYKDQYLLTHHKKRGIEFPGGKVNQGESTIDAMHRELYEETGAKAKSYKMIGTYTVCGDIPFSKDVFYVEAETMDHNQHYHETYGPILTTTLDEIKDEDKSFLLKDACILYLVDYIEEKK